MINKGQNFYNLNLDSFFTNYSRYCIIKGLFGDIEFRHCNALYRLKVWNLRTKPNKFELSR